MVEDRALKFAVSAVRAYLETCYPGWSDDDIVARPGGLSMLQVRADLGILDGPGFKAVQALDTLRRARPLVEASYPQAVPDGTGALPDMAASDARLLSRANAALEAVLSPSGPEPSSSSSPSR